MKKLTVYPAGQGPGTAGLPLLPPPQELIDGDAKDHVRFELTLAKKS